MVHYLKQGRIPPKRHVVFKEGDILIREEVFGTFGFSGRYSLLYHLNPPSKINKSVSWKTYEIQEWKVESRHHHLKTWELKQVKNPFTERIPLLFNDDVIISFASLSSNIKTENVFYRNGEYDEVYFIHQGKGKLLSMFGYIEVNEGDYVVIPRGTIYNWDLPEGTKLLIVEAKQVEIPKVYRNDYGQLLEGSFYYHRDIRTPILETYGKNGEYFIITKSVDGIHTVMVDYHPFDVIGWDGFLYPYAISAYDLEPITGKIHQPPSKYITFEGNNYMISTFVPRLLDYHPQAVPVPYYHHNVDADEFLFYSVGQFFSRRGISAGSITLHRGEFVHGPQPGIIESSLGKKDTNELAVMVETYKRLKLTTFAKEIDDNKYMLSWSQS